MKRFAFAVLVCFLITPAVADNVVAVIKDSDGYVNLRGGPGIDFPIKVRILEGERFIYLPDLESEWGRVVTSNGIAGYIHNSRYRSVNLDAYFPFVVSDPNPPANLRAGPGTEYPVAGTVPNGEFVFTLLENAPIGPDVRMILNEKTWFRVVTGDGRIGYIHHDLLKYKMFEFE